MAFWEQNQKIVVDSSGHVVECSTCPCGGGVVDGTCPCTECDGGVGPDTIQVVISGVQNDTCGTCASGDGTYLLTCCTDVDCMWAWEGTTQMCSSGLNSRFAQLTYSTSGAMTFRLLDAPSFFLACDALIGSLEMVWQSSAIASLCNAWSGISLAPLSVIPTSRCDNSTATCTVTAID